MNARLVAFEGLNGTGKTTLSRAVSARLGADWTRTPPPEAATARPLFDADPFGTASLLFHLSFVKRLSDEVAAGPPGRLVLCDRYVASTVAYFAGAGWDVGGLVTGLDIRPAELTVLVTVREDERQRRMARRGRQRRIDQATLDPAFRHRVMRVYEAQHPMITIDQTSCDEPTAAATAAESIRKHLKAYGGDYMH